MRMMSVFTTRGVWDMGLVEAATTRCSIQAQGHPSQPVATRDEGRARPAGGRLNECSVLKLKMQRQETKQRHIIVNLI